MNIIRVLSAVLLSIYFILVLIYKENSNLVSIYSLIVVAFFINIVTLTYMTKKILKLSLVFLLLFSISLVNYIYFERLSIGIIYSVLNVGLAFSLYRLFVWKPSFTVNFLLVLFFLQSVRILYALEIENVLSNDVLDGSRNHITILFGAMWSLLITLFNEIKRSHHIGYIRNALLLVVATIFIYISVLYTGRTGFALGVAILFTLYFYFIDSLTSVMGKVLLLILTFLIIYVSLDIVLMFLEDSRSFNKVTEYGASDVRWEIISNIINSTSIVNLFIGFETDITVQQMGFSPHNSFLEAYISAGLIGFLILVVFFVKIFKMVFALRSSLYFVLVIMCLVQSFFDTGTFFSPLTGFSVIFIYIVLSENCSSLKKQLIRPLAKDMN